MRNRYFFFGICLLLMAVRAPVVAQAPASGQAETAAPPSGDRPSDSVSAQQPARIVGRVLDDTGNARTGVPVRLRALADHRTARIRFTDDKGTYEFTDVRPGDYRLDVAGKRYVSSGSLISIADGDAGRTLTHDLISSERWHWTVALTLPAVLLFGLGVLAYRHHNIVHTTRELLLAQIENIRTRLPLESDITVDEPLDPAADTARTKRGKAIDALAKRLEQIRQTIPQDVDWTEWFFWSRGHEISGWVRAHEVERQLVAFLVPESRVVERAVIAEVQLRTLNSPTSLALAERLRTTLQRILDATDFSTDHHVPEHLLDHLKQQLAEGLTLLYDDGDTRFAGLMEWHNKAMWLVYLSLLTIIVLGFVYQHEELFVIGAAGGLMSRMARTLFREDVPSDYGASWTTLFLSPLLGAISAWVGIAVIVWFREVELLGDQFDRISWDDGSPVWLITLGFTLGFSERFFTSLLSKVEGKIDDSQQQKPPVAPSPIRPGGAGGRPGPAALPPGEGTPPEPAAPSHVDRILAELDVQRGERAAFIGDRASATRAKLVEIAGADAVVDVAAGTLATVGRLDAVLFETTPTIDELETAASQLKSALRPEGRVVVIGRSPAALFDADAQTQRSQPHVGPSVVREILRTAGLRTEEPPVVLTGTDPLDWLLTLIRPAADLEEVSDGTD